MYFSTLKAQRPLHSGGGDFYTIIMYNKVANTNEKSKIQKKKKTKQKTIEMERLQINAGKYKRHHLTVKRHTI